MRTITIHLPRPTSIDVPDNCTVKQVKSWIEENFKAEAQLFSDQQCQQPLTDLTRTDIYVKLTSLPSETKLRIDGMDLMTEVERLQAEEEILDILAGHYVMPRN